MTACLPPLVERLLARGPVVLDGAWGTELQALGLALGECPDVWNLSHPERVLSVARAYVEAGSDVILTNTFRANRIALEGAGLGASVREVNRAGVEISRRAAEGRALVFASIGPSGRLLAAGETDENALREAFEEQAAGLVEAGADALVIETMSDPDEAAIAVAAARETGLPTVACMVFDSGPDGDRTMTGATVETALRAVLDAGADVIGSNCGQGVEGFASLCARMRAVTDRPIWIKANAGLPELDGARVVYPATPERFAGEIPGLLRAGAGFVGGCCGTSPPFVAAVRRAVDRAR